ncbi:heparinase II/III family protein [Paenibacillus sp. YN15]|uniref:heparinase II/III domain-containing protein n=1 Tax=Paenibacillus sp. YN15 TaxID=1742774 RepID=UPI000DCCFA25|nr:heparinase II/III family protein [Paenibacillus sp. YN15]RAV03033.1 hypothetical protein DQG13_08145 [Paenibacillus sp. YN15]
MYNFREIREAICSEAAGWTASRNPFGVDWKEKLRKLKTEKVFSGYVEEATAEAKRAADEPIGVLPFSLFHLFEKQGSRLEFERPYFDRRGRLAGLVFGTLLADADEYLPALEDLIWEICNEFTWCLPAHLEQGLEKVTAFTHKPEAVIDLFAAETAHSLAETLYLLEGRLNPWIVHRVRTEIEKRTFRPLYEEPARFRWESQTHNWSAVCAGAAGMALLLLETDKERLAGIIDRLVRTMECYLEGFQPDGGCAEGIGYWVYGFGYYTYFAEMLETYTGGKIRLLDNEKCRRIAEFPLAAALSDGCFVSFSDASDKSNLSAGLVARLAERFGLEVPYLPAPRFHSDHCYRFAHLSRNFFWSKAELMGRHTPEGEWELEDLQWVVSRRKAENGLVSFSAKGGHNEEPHNHNDVGSFIIHASGSSILTDLGAGVYTKEYFGPKRYTFLHNSSRGHSVPVIDGQEQQGGRAYGAEVLEKSLCPGSVRLTLDATTAYPVPHLRQYLRSFDWSFAPGGSKGKLLLTDRFSFGKAPASLEEVFISLEAPVLEEGIATWKNGNGAVSLAYDAAAYAPEVEVIPTQAHQGEPITVYRLVLKALEPAAELVFRGEFRVEAGSGE